MPRCRKTHQIRIKLLAGDKVLVEISPYDLTEAGLPTERNAGAPGGRRASRPGGPRRR